MATLPPLVSNGYEITGPTSRRPTEPHPGQTYLDTAAGLFYVYNGTAWVNIGPGGNPGAPGVAYRFVQSADKTVFNTVTETSLVDFVGASGSAIVTADEWDIDNVLLFHAEGFYGTKDTLAGTLTLRFKTGLTGPVAVPFVLEPSDAQSAQRWSASVEVFRKSVGASGTVQGGGCVRYSEAQSPSIAIEVGMASPVALPLSVNYTVDFTAQWQNAATANTITCNGLAWELKGIP